MQREETLNIYVLEFRFFRNEYVIVFIEVAATLKIASSVFSLAFIV